MRVAQYIVKVMSYVVKLTTKSDDDPSAHNKEILVLHNA